MSGLAEALRGAGGTKGDAVSRLPLTEEERELLDNTILSGLMKDVEVADLLTKHGHEVTPYAVTYYKRKLERAHGAGR